jgi:hypothetical protein
MQCYFITSTLSVYSPLSRGDKGVCRNRGDKACPVPSVTLTGCGRVRVFRRNT